MQGAPRFSKVTGSFEQKLTAILGNLFIALGYIFIAPFVLLCIFFPPIWIPSLIIAAIAWIVFAKFSLRARTIMLQLLGMIFLGVSLNLFIKYSTIVGYKDVLTKNNVHSYASNNWGWNKDDQHNTDYVNAAVARLGEKAYGMTFGDLMDSQKAYSTQQYALAHPTPAATVESHAQIAVEHQAVRDAAKQWWDLRSVALADAAGKFKHAGQVAESGDLVSASALLSEASSDTDRVSALIPTDLPDGWDDVSESLFTASNELKKASDKLHDYLDNPLPSVGADVQQLLFDANTDAQNARMLAAAHYTQLGGKPDDL